jgi:hypothetical protein
MQAAQSAYERTSTTYFLRILAVCHDSVTRPACQESSAVPGLRKGQRLKYGELLHRLPLTTMMQLNISRSQEIWILKHYFQATQHRFSFKALG